MKDLFHLAEYIFYMFKNQLNISYTLKALNLLQIKFYSVNLSELFYLFPESVRESSVVDIALPVEECRRS